METVTEKQKRVYCPVQIGERFGRAVVINKTNRSSHGHKIYKCLCDCGSEFETAGSALRNGHTKSCGCFKRDVAIITNTKHGHTKGGKGSCEYVSWTHMVGRCTNPRNKWFSYYGGRGITVCTRWCESFESFFEDMGPRPSPKHSIDRIDVNSNYEPGNCRWASRTEQNRNTRRNVFITYDDRTLTRAEWSDITGVNYEVLRKRKRLGWSDKQIIETPVGAKRFT